MATIYPYRSRRYRGLVETSPRSAGGPSRLVVDHSSGADDPAHVGERPIGTMRGPFHVIEKDLALDAEFHLEGASIIALVIHRGVMAIVLAGMSFSRIQKHRSHGAVRVPGCHLFHGRGRERAVRSSIRAELDDEESFTPKILEVHGLTRREVFEREVWSVPCHMKGMVLKFGEPVLFRVYVENGVVILVDGHM